MSTRASLTRSQASLGGMASLLQTVAYVVAVLALMVMPLDTITDNTSGFVAYYSATPLPIDTLSAALIVLAFMTFPKSHRTQIHSTNPLERLNAEIKRRTDVVGIFPNEASITRLVGALLLEQNDEWQLQRRYMSLEALRTLSNNQPARLSAVVS